MPYIKQERRQELERLVGEIYNNMQRNSCSSGDLNYLFTITAQAYIESKNLSYTLLNDVIGALESCKQEFYRRQIVPYEEEKINENGDCY